MKGEGKGEGKSKRVKGFMIECKKGLVSWIRYRGGNHLQRGKQNLKNLWLCEESRIYKLENRENEAGSFIASGEGKMGFLWQMVKERGIKCSSPEGNVFLMGGGFSWKNLRTC